MNCTLQSDEPGKLKAVIDRQTKAASSASETLRRIWALSWLAQHAQLSELNTLNDADLADATAVVIDDIVRLTKEARRALQEHETAWAAVMKGEA